MQDIIFRPSDGEPASPAAERVALGCLRIMVWDLHQAGHEEDDHALGVISSIAQSRSHVAILQAVARGLDAAVMCRLLEERGHQRWAATDVVGEHLMLYRVDALAKMLGCTTDALVVEGALYSRSSTHSHAFRAAMDWDNPPFRFDFGLPGAGTFRLPAFFFVRALPSEAAANHEVLETGGWSLVICSVRLAVSTLEYKVREAQLMKIAPLLPEGKYQPIRTSRTSQQTTDPFRLE